MSYSAASQVVARQTAFFEDRKVLVVVELNDSYPAELVGVALSVAIFTTNYGY
ncbi:16S rRNA (guanine(1207)-N(2))-methyltransferase RsmC, partial [Photobacterium damselae]